MATTDFMSGLTVSIGNGATTEVFTSIGGIDSFSGLEKSNSLVKVTNFGSGGVDEYINGIADGGEISIKCNHRLTNAGQLALIADIDSRVSGRNIRVVLTDGTATKTYNFATVPLKWVISPSFDNVNKIEFTLKITGAITVS